MVSGLSRKMKDSGIEWIGEIPEDWGITRLKYVTKNHYSGGTPLASNSDFYSDKGYYFANISDITKQKYLNTTSKKITEDGIRNKNLKIVPRESILYAMYASVGKLSVSNVDIYISQAILSFMETEMIEKRYLVYLLIDMESFVEYLSNGTTQMNFNAEIVKNFKTLLPPKQEQKAIADYLDKKVSEIDNIITKTKKVIAEYKKYKQSLITEVVTKGLDKNVPMKDSGIEWIGEIPEHWEVVRLKDMGSIYRGTADKNIKSDELPVKLVQYTDIYYNRRLDSDYYGFLDITVTPNEYKAAKVKKGDLLLTTSSEVINDIGRSCVVMDELNNHVIGSDTLKISIPDNIIDIDYREYLIENYIYLQKFASMSRGITRYRFNMSDFKCLKYPIPPLPEQKAIASYLDEKCSQIDHIIHSKEQLLIEMEKYKKSLIYETVTGKREIK